MAAKDEDFNVNADGNQADSSEIVQMLEEISRFTQDPLVNEVESNQDDSKETTDTSDPCSLGVDSSFQNITSDQETSNEQGTSTNQLWDFSSTTSNVPVTTVEATSQPSSSDITNVETKSYVPSLDALDARIGLIIKEKLTVEDDRPLPDVEEFTNFGYTSSEYAETRDEVKELSKIDSSSSDHLEAGQSNTTASSPCRSPSIPINKRNPQANSQWQVPSGQYGNMTRSPYLPPSAPPFQQRGASNMQRYGSTMVAFPHWWRPQQICMGPPFLPPSAPPFQQHDGSNMGPYNGNVMTSPNWRPEQIYMGPPYLPPSAPPFQQHGGSNMGPYGTMVNPTYWRPEQNDIYNMPPQFDMNPYEVYTVPYGYGYANPFDMSASSRFGYEGVPGNYLSSIRQHQSGDSVVYPPSPRHSRQQRQQQLPWSDDFANQNQQDDRSDDDPSDQTQRDN